MNLPINFDRMTPSTGSLYAGLLVRGALLAASGHFSRIRRWATSATGLRSFATHGKKGPPAQPNPVATFKLYALLRRPDGQMKTVEVSIPKTTPTPRVEAAAHWEVYAHPEAKAFADDMKFTIEQVSIRPRHNHHLRTEADKLVCHHNKRLQLEHLRRAEANARWAK